MADPPPYPGAPRWAKAFGIVAIALALLALVVIVTGVGGPHGPRRHLSYGAAGGGTSPSSVPQRSVQQP